MENEKDMRNLLLQIRNFMPEKKRLSRNKKINIIHWTIPVGQWVWIYGMQDAEPQNSIQKAQTIAEEMTYITKLIQYEINSVTSEK